MSTLAPENSKSVGGKKKEHKKKKKKKLKNEEETAPTTTTIHPAVQSSSVAKLAKKGRRSYSSERSRSRIRTTPKDVFNRVPRAPAPDQSGKTRVIVLHGDPNKPNPILPGGKWDEDDFESINILKQALEKLSDKYEFSFFCNHDTLIDDLRKMVKDKSANLVLQFCDDGYMNNPRMELHVTALLEIVGLPYTGTGPVAMGMTYDKQFILSICRDLGIPTPKTILVEKDEDALELIAQHKMDFPLFIKPNNTDGSYGITTKSLCRCNEDVLEALKVIRETFFIQGPVLVQEFLEGTDMNTAIIGNPPGKFIFLPITEEDFSVIPDNLPRILGFEAKWDEHSPYFRVSTMLARSVDEETKKFMNECSAKLFNRIGIRDYARFDWKLGKDGKPRLLETNPNCGWSYDAHMQRMSALGDISYSEMLRKIIEACQDRIAQDYKKKHDTFVRVEDISQVREATKQTSANFQGELKL